MTRARDIANFGDGIATADIDDGAVTAAKLFSGFANGITVADQWRLTSDRSTNGVFTNLEQVDNSGFSNLGTAMSESSGVFTFPSTGIYLIIVDSFIGINGYDNIAILYEVTLDDSSFATLGLISQGNDENLVDGQMSGTAMIDVTDTTQVKVRFSGSSIGAGSSIRGDTSRNETTFTFIRLGDT